MSDWVNWYGGERPVPADTLVQVVVRCAPKALLEFRSGRLVGRADELRWNHLASDAGGVGLGDIIAYRLAGSGSVPARNTSEG